MQDSRDLSTFTKPVDEECSGHGQWLPLSSLLQFEVSDQHKLKLHDVDKII